MMNSAKISGVSVSDLSAAGASADLAQDRGWALAAGHN
jgi:hypothetical protein